MNGSANRKLTVFSEALQLPAHERAAYAERARTLLRLSLRLRGRLFRGERGRMYREAAQ